MNKCLFWSFVALAIVTGAPFRNALALDVNFGVKASASLTATAGLDEKTREFIDGLPAEVRKQVYILLEQALPLIDTSVQKYLDAVNRILDTQLTHLECVAIGTGQVLGADLKSSLPFASAPEPVEKLEEDADKMTSSFAVGDPPAVYRQKYSDLLYRGATTACQVAISPQASIEVSSILESVRPRWTVWYRLTGKCENAGTCYSQVLKETNEIVSKADPRDSDSASAHTRLIRVVSPRFPNRFFGKWDPTLTENSLIELLSIQDGIFASKSARQAVAKAYLDDASKLVVTAETNLSGALANQGSNDLGQLSSAISLAAAASSNGEKIRDDLAKAGDLDVSLAPQAKSWEERFQKVAMAAPAAAQAASARAEQVRAAIAQAAASAASAPQIPHGPTVFRP